MRRYLIVVTHSYSFVQTGSQYAKLFTFHIYVQNKNFTNLHYLVTTHFFSLLTRFSRKPFTEKTELQTFNVV